jgi:hypothetical protein
VRRPLTEDLQDGFALQGVTFINPFNREMDQLIEEVLSPSVTANSPLKRSA